MPVKPKLGVFNSIVWGLKKLFTLGFGDTDANRKLKQDLKKYNEELIPEYKKKMAVYQNMKGYYTRLQDADHINKLKSDQGKLRNEYKKINARKYELFDQIYKDGYQRQAEVYRSKIEVKLA
ncbi:MAG: hypothetical protein IKG91_04080, partial [Firmicutes bacterium]|nr:hypothetical protein [Bacillota bacterium]